MLVSYLTMLCTRVINLLEMHEYEFRVAAVNAAGQGPYSAASDLICCQPPKSEYT